MALIRANQISGSVASAVTASYALTTDPVFPFTGFAIITGSLEIKAGPTDIFIIKNYQTNQPILVVSQSGIITIATQSIELATTAPVGGIYFTSSSFFVGLE